MNQLIYASLPRIADCCKLPRIPEGLELISHKPLGIYDWSPMLVVPFYPGRLRRDALRTWHSFWFSMQEKNAWNASMADYMLDRPETARAYPEFLGKRLVFTGSEFGPVQSRSPRKRTCKSGVRPRKDRRVFKTLEMTARGWKEMTMRKQDFFRPGRDYFAVMA